MIFIVGISVGVCEFKLIHYAYNSVCYEVSLTAGTAPLFLFNGTILFPLKIHKMKESKQI